MTTNQTAFKKRFGQRGQYHAELILNVNGEGGNGVYIEYKARSGKSFNASLSCAMDTGELESHDGTAHVIESALLDDIEAWAIENGY
jgi:hypothetical protein